MLNKVLYTFIVSVLRLYVTWEVGPLHLDGSVVCNRICFVNDQPTSLSGRFDVCSKRLVIHLNRLDRLAADAGRLDSQQTIASWT